MSQQSTRRCSAAAGRRGAHGPGVRSSRGAAKARAAAGPASHLLELRRVPLTRRAGRVSDGGIGLRSSGRGQLVAEGQRQDVRGHVPPVMRREGRVEAAPSVLREHRQRRGGQARLARLGDQPSEHEVRRDVARLVRRQEETRDGPALGQQLLREHVRRRLVVVRVVVVLMLVLVRVKAVRVVRVVGWCLWVTQPAVRGGGGPAPSHVKI